MDYRHWPPEPSEPPRDEPAAGTVGGPAHDTWASWYSSGDPGAYHPPDPHRHGSAYDAAQGYDASQGYGAPGYHPDATRGYRHDATQSFHQDATQSYPAVRPSRGSTQSPPAALAGHPSAVASDEPATTPALAWTAGLFIAPVLLFLLWAATRSGVAPADCVDASGAPCSPPRTAAIRGLVGILPGLAGALVLALLTVVGLKRIATNWRPSTVALAAAVIGAGIATLIGNLLA